MLNFPSHLLQKDQESLLKKNRFKDSSPRHDLGFLLGLENCALLNRCQDHQFWDLHIKNLCTPACKAKGLYVI